MNTETVTVLPKGEDFEIIVQHAQSGSAYGMPLSKNAYEQLRQHFVSGQLPLPSERFDAEDWLGERKDIWNHPRVTDRNDKESYDVADLMAEFANWYYGNGNLR